MKRELTKEEHEINVKQLLRHKELVIELEKNIEYNKSLIQLQENKRNHDNKFRDYLRERKTKEDSQIIKQINKELKSSGEHIKMLTTQLKEGVEVKKPTGV
ncbi:MAG: hypothetical protein IIA87_03550 [Nanoarchaeota archaeon]|nr:hypothetical protein [Nanoarchaeota archaeon]